MSVSDYAASEAGSAASQHTQPDLHTHFETDWVLQCWSAAWPGDDENSTRHWFDPYKGIALILVLKCYIQHVQANTADVEQCSAGWSALIPSCSKWEMHIRNWSVLRVKWLFWSNKEYIWTLISLFCVNLLNVSLLSQFHLTHPSLCLIFSDIKGCVQCVFHT